MSKTLSDTGAIAAKPVVETSNPDFSGFRARHPYRCMCLACQASMPRVGAGSESLHHAVQVLEAKKPGSSGV